jgi:hypothetical protein
MKSNRFGESPENSEAGNKEVVIIPGAELLDRSLGDETEKAFERVEQVVLRAEALAESNPKLRERALSLRDRARKLQKQVMGAARVIGLGAAVMLAAEAADYELTRYNVSEHADNQGKVVFEHQDEETTRILDYLSGNGDLRGRDRLNFEMQRIRTVAKNARIAIPDKLEDMNEDQLSELWDTIERSLYEKYQLPTKYVDGQLKKTVPTRYEHSEELYKALWAIEREAGNPRIRFEDFSKQGSINGRLGVSTDRAHYNGATNTMYIDYPMSVLDFERKDGLPKTDAEVVDDFVSEASHGKQWEDKPLSHNFLMLENEVSVFYQAMREGKAPNEIYLETQYGKPGTIEYEAHRQIQPELEKKLDGYKEEKAKEWEKEIEEGRKRALESGGPFPN